MEIVPVISDLQVPFHDKRSVAAVATWIADLAPSRVACVGDLLDQTQVGKWVRGKAGEYDGQLAASRDKGIELMRDLRITDLSRSNHDDRLEKYVREHAPALAGLPELTTEEFMGLNELGIRFHRKPHEIVKNWLLMHGDESGYSRLAGMTALQLARKAGKSVVCGHTHKVGLTHDHPTFNGKVQREIWGWETGNLMDAKHAHYMGGGIMNWQQSVGALVVDGNDVYPIPVLLKNHKLYWEGHTYRG